MKVRPYVMPNPNPSQGNFFKRHPIFSLIGLPPLFMLTLMITITLGVGFAQAIGSNHSPNQITIEKTDSTYNDCVTFANARGFAPDVCESLDTKSTVAKVNCAYEGAYKLPKIDCPTSKG